MLPEIFEDLCIRDDVVAIRFPGERLSAWKLEEANGGKHFPHTPTELAGRHRAN